jgi:hypothetical protein
MSTDNVTPLPTPKRRRRKSGPPPERDAWQDRVEKALYALRCATTSMVVLHDHGAESCLGGHDDEERLGSARSWIRDRVEEAMERADAAFHRRPMPQIANGYEVDDDDAA